MDNPALTLFIFNFQWMGWNLVLAAMPFLLAVLLFKRKVKINILWLIGFVLFIVFLPNAPYVVTDVIHLYKTVEQANSFLVLLLLVYQYIALLLIGLFFFVASYYKFEVFIHKRNKISVLATRIPLFIAVAIGVYLGRSLRLNSWDVFFSPKASLASLLALNSLDAFIFTTVFTLLLFAVYYLYIRLNK